MRFTIIVVLIFNFFFCNAQHTHDKIEHTLSVGFGGVVFPYASIQIEHTFYDYKFSIGEHFKEFYAIKEKSILYSGPQLEIFGRYYFTDQKKKHGSHWFLNIKGIYGNSSIPWSDNTDDYLYDVNNILALGNDGKPIKIYGDNFTRFGGGAAFGFKTCSCKDFIFEVLLGYQFITKPNYYSDEYINWTNDDPCNCTDYVETKWENGFPIDLQIKVGFLL